MLPMSPPATKRHPVFAAVYDRLTASPRPRERRLRAELLAGLHGDVLEIGVGVGNNWPFLLRDGIRYVGIDPDTAMLERARRRAAALGLAVDLRCAPAEAIPFPDRSFDAVVSTLTLCTVDDPDRAIAEIRRVLRPGGELRFWEHVRPAGAMSGRFFDALTPAWGMVAGGCHLNRATVASLEAGGFRVRVERRFRMLFLPMVVGRAVPVDAAGALY